MYLFQYSYKGTSVTLGNNDSTLPKSSAVIEPTSLGPVNCNCCQGNTVSAWDTTKLSLLIRIDRCSATCHGKLAKYQRVLSQRVWLLSNSKEMRKTNIQSRLQNKTVKQTYGNGYTSGNSLRLRSLAFRVTIADLTLSHTLDG